MVCVDAGLAVKLVSPEADSADVETLFAQWKEKGIAMIAPAFAPAEMDSVLRQKVIRGELSRRFPIAVDTETDCRERAWDITTQFEFPTVYDAVYLALAEAHHCEFWTADQKLFARVRKTLSYVKHVTESR